MRDITCPKSSVWFLIKPDRICMKVGCILVWGTLRGYQARTPNASAGHTIQRLAPNRPSALLLWPPAGGEGHMRAPHISPVLREVSSC